MTPPPSVQVDSLSRVSEPTSLPLKEFETSLLVTHYLATRAAAEGVPEMAGIVARISTSLLRYSTLLPVDRAFYQAGIHCRVSSLLSPSHTKSMLRCCYRLRAGRTRPLSFSTGFWT